MRHRDAVAHWVKQASGPGAMRSRRGSRNKTFHQRDASPVDILVQHAVRSAGGDGLRAKLAQLSG